MPTTTQSAAFLNWTRILTYNKNITRHHIRIGDDHDDDITSLAIVCVGLGIMIIMLVLHKCSRDDRPVRCCNSRRENEDMIHVVNAQDPISRKDTPPPPYEDPPSYHIAVQMEIEMCKRDLRVAGPS